MADWGSMAGIVKNTLALLRAPGNAVAFTVRSRVRWSRGKAELQNESKERLFDHLPTPRWAEAGAEEQRMCADYGLDALRARSTCLVYAENLAVLEAMERACDGMELPVGPDGALRAADVGCGVFQYATALQRFLAQGGTGAPRRAILRGIEIDGHGVYADGHSRADYARAHVVLAGDDAHFQVGDFTALPIPEQDMVTMWFPFVERYALLQWGLPLSLFDPTRLVERAVATVRPGGLLFVANQTEHEAETIQAMLRSMPTEHVRTVSIATDLVPYAEKTAGRIASVWRRC
ncbi:MAG: hypothetical protein RLZZ562_2582 [Planctomycetota bacterium]